MKGEAECCISNAPFRFWGIITVFLGGLLFSVGGEMDVAKTKKGAHLAPPYVVYLRFLAPFERANELLRLHPKVLGLEP